MSQISPSPAAATPPLKAPSGHAVTASGPESHPVATSTGAAAAWEQQFTADGAPDLMAQAWRLRHRVFNETLGWALPHRDGLEIDAFDLAGRHCAVGEGDRLLGYMRALPTTAPYLLSEHFAHLLDGPVPRSAGIWEVSRYAVAPDRGRDVRLQRRLVRLGVVMARDIGAELLIAVTEPAFARFLKSCGLRIDVMAQPTVVGQGRHGPVKAMVISCPVDEANLRALDIPLPPIS